MASLNGCGHKSTININTGIPNAAGNAIDITPATSSHFPIVNLKITKQPETSTLANTDMIPVESNTGVVYKASYATLVGQVQTGLEPSITPGTTSQYLRGDKTFQTLDKGDVDLDNVDNTSDANKPVSTATQAAINSALNITATSPLTFNSTSKVISTTFTNSSTDMLLNKTIANFVGNSLSDHQQVGF